jgi:hypothetical protein
VSVKTANTKGASIGEKIYIILKINYHLQSEALQLLLVDVVILLALAS